MNSRSNAVEVNLCPVESERIAQVAFWGKAHLSGATSVLRLCSPQVYSFSEEMSDKLKSVRIRNKRNELLILSRNRRSCCICHSSGPVQIHHIDGRPDHDALNNLAVLCLSHHDQATAGLNPGQVGLGKKLTPEEVRLHKKTWERAVSEERAWKRRFAPQDRRKSFIFLFDFELMRVKNEILASRSKEAIESRFEYLSFLSHEFSQSPSPYRKLLLNAYGDLAVRGRGVKEIALSIVNALDNECANSDAMEERKWKLSRTDKWALTQCARILGQVGYGAVIFEKDTDVVVEVCRSLNMLLAFAALGFGFEQLPTEVRIAFHRMRSETERLPWKRKASRLGAEYKKRIHSAFEELEQSLVNFIK